MLRARTVLIRFFEEELLNLSVLVTSWRTAKKKPNGKTREFKDVRHNDFSSFSKVGLSFPYLLIRVLRVMLSSKYGNSFD